MNLASAIYSGPVVHERFRPKRHSLRYCVFALLLDLDELADLDRKHGLIAYNRRGILSFHDSDHGPATGEALRPWVEARLEEANIEPDGGAIRLLCYPRIMGYVFNPLSVYFCYRLDGSLAAILYEVCNTYRERHTYVIPVHDSSGRVVRQKCSKALYVSPFSKMETEYLFRMAPPADHVGIAIRQEDDDGLLLAATFSGTRSALTRAALLRCLARFPFLCFKVIAGIHWEAFRMWLKGFPTFSHSPAASPVGSSIGETNSS